MASTKRSLSPPSTHNSASMMPSAIIWDTNASQFSSWVSSLPAFSQDQLFKSKLLPNLIKAVTPLLPKDPLSSPPAKRIKVEQEKQPPAQALNDPYNVWVDQPDVEQVPTTFGAICVQLTQQGLLNGLTLGSSDELDATLDIHKLSTALHRAIQIKMERDFLDTTPNRIREMLCGDLGVGEFRSIRKRVYDTVILGKGMSIPEVEGDGEIVTARTNVHNVEKFKKCKVCGNNDQALFVLDRKNGNVICTSCGTVAMESVMHEGPQYRKFEREVDRNHHGDASNPLYSNAHNMSTTLGGMQMTSSVNQGFGTQSKGIENVLRNAHAYTELNLSQYGKNGERRTRIGYKDRQKRDAFHQMTHVGDALNLHEAVVQRAKELFAGFRDDRELVQQFKGVIAACLCEAFEQLSRDGHRLLKLREQDSKALLENNKRANRRNELHHATMAGKGGLLLDFSHVPGAENGDSKPEAKSTPSPKANAAIDQKSASTWDLDDCRSFLLEASRNIAQQWIKDRNAGAKNIPEGSQDELEGKLVEHTIVLCDQLEAELKARDQKVAGKKVVTPRVQDMAQLGIKWQHSHERGSGGKGGVGGSGWGTNQPSGRTAGQLLILKTSKKLGAILKDTVAGEAFHKESRALVGRQEARKRKGMADEAARQRFQQMKRKPWLQARAESGR